MAFFEAVIQRDMVEDFIFYYAYKVSGGTFKDAYVFQFPTGSSQSAVWGGIR